MCTTIWAIASAGIGLLLGPALATWAYRASRSTRSRSPAWWRGGGAPGRVVATVSAVTSLLFALLALRYAGSATWPAWCWLVVTGVVLATIDIRLRRLPYRATAAMAIGGGLALAAAAAVEGGWSQFVSAVLSAAVVLTIAAAVQLLWPGHTGGGDTMLYAALALYLGWFGVSGLLRGLLLATGLTALVALVVWAARRQSSATFPAGPSLIAGALLAVMLE